MDFKQTLDENINPLRDAYEIDSEIFDFYKDVITLIAQEYAAECAKASLEKASDNVLIDDRGIYPPSKIKQSITSPDNIVLL